MRVAGELDIDLADAFPKSVTSEAVQVADVIITLGEAALSAVGVDLAERQVRHWDLPVLADQPDDAIRDVLVELDRHTLLLLADLLAMPAAGTD